MRLSFIFQNLRRRGVHQFNMVVQHLLQRRTNGPPRRFEKLVVCFFACPSNFAVLNSEAFLRPFRADDHPKRRSCLTGRDLPVKRKERK